MAKCRAKLEDGVVCSSVRVGCKLRGGSMMDVSATGQFTVDFFGTEMT